MNLLAINTVTWAVPTAVIVIVIIAEITYSRSRKTKLIPEFFIYYGEHSMCLNKELIDKLTEKDVTHLSEAERKFFKFVKEKGLLDVHSGSVIKRLPQEEECRFLLQIFEDIDSGNCQEIKLSEIF